MKPPKSEPHSSNPLSTTDFHATTSTPPIRKPLKHSTTFLTHTSKVQIPPNKHRDEPTIMLLNEHSIKLLSRDIHLYQQISAAISPHQRIVFVQ